MLLKKILLSLTITLCLAANCTAQVEGDSADKNVNKAATRAIKTTTTRMMKLFERAELTEDQKAKVKTIIEMQAPKVAAARKAQESLLTDSQKKARKTAIAKLKEQGVKGRKRQKGAFDAMKLTEEELKKYKSASKKTALQSKQIRDQISALLSEEQLKAMPKPRSKNGNKKGTDKSIQTVSLKLPGMT